MHELAPAQLRSFQSFKILQHSRCLRCQEYRQVILSSPLIREHHFSKELTSFKSQLEWGALALRRESLGADVSGFQPALRWDFDRLSRN